MKTTEPQADFPWNVPVSVNDVPEDGQHLDLTAPDEVRNDIARMADVRSVEKLAASFDVMPLGDGLHVTGKVSAIVGQSCVVTLEPMDSAVDETIDLTFSPSVVENPDVIVISNGNEPPDPLIGGVVDLGVLATEFLLLGIDPYPRKHGAEFAPAQAGALPDPAEHPFAALQALKKDPKA